MSNASSGSFVLSLDYSIFNKKLIKERVEQEGIFPFCCSLFETSTKAHTELSFLNIGTSYCLESIFDEKLQKLLN